MIVETVHLISEALRSSEYGVNAKLAGVPLLDHHERPRDVARVLDALGDDGLARGDLGSDYPMLLVAAIPPVQLDGEVTTTIRDTASTGITVPIGYATELANLGTAAGRREAWYTTRAVVRCLRTLASNAKSDDRKANGVQLREFVRIDVDPEPATLKIGDAEVGIGASVFVSIVARDLEP